MPQDDRYPWEDEGDLPWASDELEALCSESNDDAWRGSTHLADWPEDLAGPEYWLYKSQDDAGNA